MLIPRWKRLGGRAGDPARLVASAVRAGHALRCHFDESATPRLIRLHFVRDEVIAA